MKSTIYKVPGIISILFAIAIFSSSLAHGQRAESASERNSDVKEINALYNLGKWEEGRQIAESILKKSPKDSDVRMMLGKYYLHKKQYDKARYELVKSLEYAPANVESKHLLVTVETETQRYSSAVCYINELLEVNPYWKGLWRQKIELYRTMGNNVEADRLLKRLSQIYPEDHTLKKDQEYVVEQRIISNQKLGKLDEAIELSKKRITEQPAKQTSYVSIIDDYIKAGDYNNALIYTERGLNTFPNSGAFIQKKIAILDHYKRYSEILSLLEQQMKVRGDFRNEYSYFLLEAARNAKKNEAATLYGRIFTLTPNNKEAFDYVFMDMIAKEQYENAVEALNRHKKSVVVNKDLDMKELMVYKRMGDATKVSALTRRFFKKYPEDTDLKGSFIAVVTNDAKENMLEGNTISAIENWKILLEYGDEETVTVAKRGIYNAYVSDKRYQDAILILDEILLDAPGDRDLLLKKSDLYQKEGRYDYAINLYEQVLGNASEQDRSRLMTDFNDLVLSRVKALRENYHLVEARQLCDRWLTIDPRNQDALLYMINICYQLKDTDSMFRYAQIAEKTYGDNVPFKIKLAEAMNHNPEKRVDSWNMLYDQVKLSPYHEPLVNTFIQTTEEYAKSLLKEKKYDIGLSVLDSALIFKNNKDLKYMKGLAFEGLKKFDSAYVYQQFYDPTLMEFDDYKNHLNYLLSRTLRNNIGISYLRSRYGDDYAITSISSVEYTHYLPNASYFTGRIHYAGREEGKGLQGQVEWFQPWNDKLSTRLDLGLSNKYFAKVSANGSIFYLFNPSWEAELGLGMKSLYTMQNLFNANLGLSKSFDDLKLSAKWSNIMLDSEGELIYLYNLGGKIQYYLANPKNYFLAVGSFGNSPDVDVLNNQFYNSFDVFNAMVGAGLGRTIAKNISGNVMGTWQNFQTARGLNGVYFRNLYNFYFQLNVSF